MPAFDVRGGIKAGEARAQDFRARVSFKTRRSVRPSNDGSLGIEHQNRVILDPFHQITEEFLAIPQLQGSFPNLLFECFVEVIDFVPGLSDFLLGYFVVVDIRRGAKPAYHRPVPIADWYGPPKVPAICAVRRAPNSIFDFVCFAGGERPTPPLQAVGPVVGMYNRLPSRTARFVEG